MRAPVVKMSMRLKAQPGQGAPTGGAGRDTPEAGQERSQFEKDRQGRMQGSGGDRPPVYVPKDDGERGGYKNRISRGPRPFPRGFA
jgi:hypothetical protein